MSLRVFHLVFIAVSVALSAFVAAWGVREWRASGSASALGLAVVFFASGVGLIASGVHAGRKFPELQLTLIPQYIHRGVARPSSSSSTWPPRLVPHSPRPPPSVLVTRA